MGISGLVAIAMFLSAFVAEAFLPGTWGAFLRNLFSPDPESVETFSLHGTKTGQSDGEPFIAALRN